MTERRGFKLREELKCYETFITFLIPHHQRASNRKKRECIKYYLSIKLINWKEYCYLVQPFTEILVDGIRK